MVGLAGCQPGRHHHPCALVSCLLMHVPATARAGRAQSQLLHAACTGAAQVALDQITYGPLANFTFFAFCTLVVEGGVVSSWDIWECCERSTCWAAPVPRSP